MKNILFPTNLSKPSAKALNYAIDLARYHGAELTIFHVFQSNNGPRRPIFEERTPSEKALKKLCDFAKLHTEGSTYKSLRYKVQKGPSISSIIKESKDKNYDLLILGKSLEYDWLTRILGSKTSYISKKAHCPVFVVPAGNIFQGIQNVLITGKAPGKRKDALERYLDKISSDQGMVKHTFFNSTKKNGQKATERRDDSIRRSTISGLDPFGTFEIKRRLEDKINKMNIDLLVVNLDKSGLLLRQFGFRGWSQVILGLKVPTLVVNKQFVNSDRVRTTFPSLLRDSKLMTYFNPQIKSYS